MSTSGDARAALEARFEAASAALPKIAVDRAHFEELARQCAFEAQGASAAEGALEIVIVAGLLSGDRAAEAELERRYLAPIGPRVGTVALESAELDEVKQRTRAKLLVAEAGQTPKIVGYAGKGRLGGLVRVVATREALDLRRAERRQRPLHEELAEPAGAAWDPGLTKLDGEARARFVAAFEAAVRAASSRERTLLRLHLLGGVTLEKLAAMHNVHRATIVRWLAGARESILARTRAELGASLNLSGAELESLMDSLRQSLDLSVERLLMTTDVHGP